MNEPPPRGALMLVHFVAVCVIGIGLLEIGLTVADSFARHVEVPVVACALWAIPFALGVVIVFKARAIAAWLAKKIEE